jgi:undecaprenyl-diphosphatase
VDLSIEQWINGPAGAHPFLDEVMKAGADLAQLVFIALVGVWFLVGWVRARPEDRRGAIAALGAAAVALLVNQVISHIWNRPRPFVAHPDTVHVLLSRGTDPSFPSDHAAAAFAIAAVLVVVHRRLGVLVLLLAALVGYARVYVGAHYPGDVAGGAVIGIGAAVVILTWLRPLILLAARSADAVMLRLRLLKPGT